MTLRARHVGLALLVVAGMATPTAAGTARAEQGAPQQETGNAAVDEETTGDPQATSYRGGLELARIWEEDVADGPSLAGYRLAFASISRRQDSRLGHAGSLYGEWKRSSAQEIFEAGLALAFPYFQPSRMAVGPRFRLAIQHRAEGPDDGTDGVLGVGFELGVWLSRRVQLSVTADRSTGFRSAARNAASLNLRIMLWKDRQGEE